MAGYSATPLVKNIGFKPGFRVRIKNAPRNYDDLVSPLPADIIISANLRKDIDIEHIFVTSRTLLARILPGSLKANRQNGMIWVSWPKKASGVKTDITEDVIRELALPLGLVDDTWSGLKLVIRKELRK